jgi:3-phosphoshikimate 1-carboxyvinyltransferase
LVNVQIRRSKINGTIRCPSSKSYTHRAIAVASLVESPSIITNVLIARDTLATLTACRSLGANIIHNKNNTLRIEGKRRFDPPDNVVNAENSGTTIRFLTVMSSLAHKGFTVLTGDESLRKRPMQPILDALQQLGVQCYSTKMNGTPPLIVRGGGIKGGTAVIDGTVSSQFISALLISCIYADTDVTLKVKGAQVSAPYIDATLATMKAFGVSVKQTKKFSEYHIYNEEYKSTFFDIPADFSTAALIIAAGVLAGHRLTIQGINFSLPQADSHIIEIIKSMGGKIRVDRQKGEVIVHGSSKLSGGDFDLTNSPDLLPVVSILALKSTKTVRIMGIAHARLKETDRVSNIAIELAKFGANIKELKDEISITPPTVIKNASVEAYNDHRLFMAFTIASMLTEKSIVAGAESVDVSYPNFIQDMVNLGADMKSLSDSE